MTVSKFIGLAAFATGLAAAAAPAGAYERDYNRGSTYNQRAPHTAPATPRRNDTVVITPRTNTKVIIIARDHDEDARPRGHYHHKFWKRWHRWNAPMGRGYDRYRW